MSVVAPTEHPETLRAAFGNGYAKLFGQQWPVWVGGVLFGIAPAAVAIGVRAAAESGHHGGLPESRQVHGVLRDWQLDWPCFYQWHEQRHYSFWFL